MPDAKRKLPVLYAEIQDIEDAEHSGAGDVWCIVDDIGKRDRQDFARYEPAVPRCRTCNNYIQTLDGRRCEHPTLLWTPGASENGFCHNHSDLK